MYIGDVSSVNKYFSLGITLVFYVFRSLEICERKIFTKLTLTFILILTLTFSRPKTYASFFSSSILFDIQNPFKGTYTLNKQWYNNWLFILDLSLKCKHNINNINIRDNGTLWCFFKITIELRSKIPLTRLVLVICWICYELKNLVNTAVFFPQIFTDPKMYGVIHWRCTFCKSGSHNVL